MKVRFKEWNCIVRKKKYNNARTALELVDAIDGSPIAMATVNLPETQLNPHDVIIKDWSENEGMVRALVTAGVIAEPHRTVRTDFVEAHIAKLLMSLMLFILVGCGVTPKLYYSQEEMWSISRPLWQNKDHKHGFFIYPDSMFVTYVPKKGCVMNYELYDNDYLYLP